MFARSSLPLIVAALTPLFAGADEGWHRIEVRNAVTYDKRSVPGTKFNEYRAAFDVNASPAEALAIIWNNISLPPGPHITKRVFLKKTSDEIVIHDQIKTKVVSDRELTLRMWKEPNVVHFQARNDLGPPPTTGYVQLPVVRGSWVLDGAPTGTHVTYMCYSEPGGSVPAFLVRGAQQEQIVKDVEHVREQLK